MIGVVFLENLNGKEVKLLKCFLFKFNMQNPGEGNGSPLQYPCLENPVDRGVWWSTVQGVTKSRA